MRSLLNVTLFKENYKKNKRLYIPVLISVSIFELLMIVYSFFNFSFSNPRHITYFMCYVILLIASIVCLSVVCIYWNRIDENINKIKITATSYEFVMFAWATVISSLDCISGDYPIVFLTIMFVLPFIFISDPHYLSTLSAIGSAAIMIVYSLCCKHISASFYINLFVATFMNILTIHMSHKAFVNEYNALERFKSFAFIDALTGINNRRSFDDKLSSVIHIEGTYLAIIDLDEFKKINDTYGHKAGDGCLKFFANELSSRFNKDEVFRFGGDEYAIISQYSLAVLESKLNALKFNIAQSSSHYKSIRFSVGLYKINHNDSERHAIQCADKALYYIKNHGKGSLLIYSEYLNDLE